LPIPTLHAGRLILRAPSLDDFASSFAMWSDAGVTRHITGKPNTREEVWGRLLRYAGHWCLMGYGYWVVEDAADGGYVGEVGFGDYRRDIDPPLDGIPEIGWVLAPSAQGRGFASEAATRALAWRDAALPPGDTVCLIQPQNAPSLRVAAKLGFTVAGVSVHRGESTVILRRGLGGGTR